MTEWTRKSPPHPKLTGVYTKIYKLLAEHPAGLDIVQIRQALGTGEGEQEHLNRRVRHLRKFYDLPRKMINGRHVYVLEGLKKNAHVDDGSISGRLRAEILHLAKGRCQMCGKTVIEDGVRLQIDHKIPQTWGGATSAYETFGTRALG